MSEGKTKTQAPDASAAMKKEAITIVGVGASAGGLDALKALLGATPAHPGVAIVVILHLSPEHESHLAEVIQPHCHMPVEQVRATTKIECDHVYVIPPNANLNSIDTHLRLSKLEKERSQRAPIDHFFKTLATSHEGNAVGIILTGTGSDGTIGLRRIKEGGGLTIVQDPDEAEHDGMPRSAIASGIVDLVLPVRSMPEEFLRFAHSCPNLEIPVDDESADSEDAHQLLRIFAHLRSRSGNDFNNYKRTTILRRVRRRMQIRQIDTLGEYLGLIREDGHEAQELVNDFLITVTGFFRDRQMFEYLANEYLPRLLRSKSSRDRIRIWSVGCSTGEEAYSLAMLLLEEAGRMEVRPEIQVFASDLHERSLRTAREGTYPYEIAADVSPERLERFFVNDGAHYRVRRELREMVVFASHNLLHDPPFSHLDLILCRNLLIYLQRHVQHDVASLFHYALEPGGLLVLGTSETVDRSELFSCINKSLSIYHRRDVPSNEPRVPPFPVMPGRGAESRETVGRGRKSGGGTGYGVLHERVVERYAPPSVLVNPNHEIIHSSYQAGDYLKVSGGEPTKNLFKLVLEPLRVELRSALEIARGRQAPANSKPIKVTVGGEKRFVVIRVHPVSDPDLTGFSLVIFDTIDVPGIDSTTPVEASQSTSLLELETELDLTRQRLQSLSEEYETSREEMQASNEELQSANEELRSTMEELETSKEELQSMNEELVTLNQENRQRIEEMAQLTADLNGLLSSTQIATLFLDRDLRIVRFTPQVTKLFNIRHTDQGRPLTDLTNRLGYTALQSDARQVLDGLMPIEREINCNGDQWYLGRILPYRTVDDRIEGVVVTLIDITKLRRQELELRRSQERYRLLVESAHEYAIFIVDNCGNISFWNKGAVRNLGYSEQEIMGRNFGTIFTETDREKNIPMNELQKAITHGRVSNKRWYQRKDGTLIWASGELSALGGDVEFGLSMVLRNETEEKRQEEQLRTIVAELNHRVKNTLATIQAISWQTASNSADLPSFITSFERRLKSLAAAHGLLTKSQWQGAFLGDIVKSELRTYEPSGKRHTITGPGVNLKPDRALAVHMIIHELTTNACKYGALRPGKGHVDIRWDLKDGEHNEVEIIWKESCDTAIGKPGKDGYGFRLVTDLVEYELQGQLTRTFEEDGLQCTVRYPLNGREFQPGSEGRIVPAEDIATNAVLIVEDNTILAKTLCRQLEERQFKVLGPVGTLKQAESLLNLHRPRVAVLDVDLGGVKVYPLARRLREEKIPILLITGYSVENLPEELGDVPIFFKPVDIKDVVEFLHQYV